MLCKSCTMPPIVVDNKCMCLLAFCIVSCNLPIASPCLSITLITQRLSTYVFAEPWPTFAMSTASQFFFVKTCNDFILLFVKGLNWKFCVYKNGNYSVVEGMMGCILILTWRFIPNHFKKWSMKYQNTSSKNTLKPCFVCDVCSVEKQRINKQVHQLGFCFYIVKAWKGAPINLMWLLKEPVGKSLSTSHVVR